MRIPKHIKDGIVNSVGYREADNQTSFLTGAQVAFSWAEDSFSKEHEAIVAQRDQYKKAYEQVKTDMLTLVSIINQYTP